MATFLRTSGSVPLKDSAPGFPSGPALSIGEWAALAKAPRRTAGTDVSVLAKPVFSWWPDNSLVQGPQHMYVQYDDGRRQLIARGGPEFDGAEFFGGWLDGSNRVTAGVYPAVLSKDYGTGRRELFHGFLPGVSVDQAAQVARDHAAGVNTGGNNYGLDTNSNSFAADIIEDQFGHRVGDRRTPGYSHRLVENRPPPPPIDLSSAFSIPAW